LAGLNLALPPPGWTTLTVPSGESHAPVRIHFLATFGTLAPLGLAGIVLTWRRWRRLLPLYVVLFGYMLTVLLFFNFARFRVPVVPILALFASESLLAGGRFVRRFVALAAAFAARAGDMAAKAKDLFTGWEQATAMALLALTVFGLNVEWPRGV